MLFDSSSYSWKWSWIGKESTPGTSGKPPTPPARPDLEQSLLIHGRDLRPSSFQDYLLDLVSLAGIRAPVGDLDEADSSPVANWLRSKGLKLVFSDEETRYLVTTDSGERLCALPDYLVRYLELLDDDSFSERIVPAYQALALLSYVVTTERYRLP